MIKKITPLTMSEVMELSKEGKKSEQINVFIKKFSPLKIEDIKKLREELKQLDLVKLKEEFIVKIIDFLPEDASDLNKIIADVSFDQDEVTKILDVIKKYK
ncbi:MAG: hypothetical protein ACOYT4_01550 [Nanoarchaeota archaeon]